MQDRHSRAVTHKAKRHATRPEKMIFENKEGGHRQSLATNRAKAACQTAHDLCIGMLKAKAC